MERETKRKIIAAMTRQAALSGQSLSSVMKILFVSPCQRPTMPMFSFLTKHWKPLQIMSYVDILHQEHAMRCEKTVNSVRSSAYSVILLQLPHRHLYSNAAVYPTGGAVCQGAGSATGPSSGGGSGGGSVEGSRAFFVRGAVALQPGRFVCGIAGGTAIDEQRKAIDYIRRA